MAREIWKQDNKRLSIDDEFLIYEELPTDAHEENLIVKYEVKDYYSSLKFVSPPRGEVGSDYGIGNYKKALHISSREDGYYMELGKDMKKITTLGPFSLESLWGEKINEIDLSPRYILNFENSSYDYDEDTNTSYSITRKIKASSLEEAINKVSKRQNSEPGLVAYEKGIKIEYYECGVPIGSRLYEAFDPKGNKVYPIESK